jgi:hypothetical protein
LSFCVWLHLAYYSSGSSIVWQMTAHLFKDWIVFHYIFSLSICS